jgi:3-deoxy-D-manno-octulosonic-acid transferase
MAGYRDGALDRRFLAMHTVRIRLTGASQEATLNIELRYFAERSTKPRYPKSMADTKTSLLRLGGRGLARLIKYVEKTSDIVYDPPDLKARLRETHPCIVAGWHGQSMMTVCLHPGDIRVEAMLARHSDAEMLAAALERLNTNLIRGAGAGDRKRDRGGATALRLSLRSLKSGASLVMTADFPPAPARQAGIGVIMIAKMSGCPIVPVASATRRFASFDTYSRMTINMPFSKLAFAGGAPIHVPRDADDKTMELKRAELEAALNAVNARAYKLAGADINRAIPLYLLAAKSPPPPGMRLKIYRGAMSALRPAIPLLLNMREKRGKEDATRRGERLGIASAQRPAGRVIWTHAASVGETLSVLPLIDDILQLSPEITVLLTTGTTTSAELAKRRLPARAIHQFIPIDVPEYVTRFLDFWRPDLAIFTESDIWPNLILGAADRKIPLALVNARMSPRSQKRWRKNARIGRALFSRFSVALAQNSAVARSIHRLGAPNVVVAGNLKIDAPAPPVDSDALDALRAAIGERPIFLASSTHPGEEEIIAAAHRDAAATAPRLLTIIAPRHPERGPGLAEALRAQGFSTPLRSAGALPDPQADIYVADTIGELGTLYALASLAFIGGSLIPHGGQNPIEAVRRDCAVLTGRHHHNFRDIYETLTSANGAIVANSASEIADAVRDLFANPEKLAAMRNAAAAALETISGAQAKTLAALKPYILRPQE